LCELCMPLRVHVLARSRLVAFCCNAHVRVATSFFALASFNLQR
jgi:hypothetical protein